VEKCFLLFILRGDSLTHLQAIAPFFFIGMLERVQAQSARQVKVRFLPSPGKEWTIRQKDVPYAVPFSVAAGFVLGKPAVPFFFCCF